MSLDYIHKARERLTPTSSTGFSAANIPNVDPNAASQNRAVRFVRIQAIAGTIWFREDGDPATTATGNKLTNGGSLEIWGNEAMRNFRCIDNGDSAELECEYMGVGG